jgi:branched-chain amino acid transport system permease protein
VAERWRRVGTTLLPAALILLLQQVLFPMPVGAVASGAVLGLLGALGALGLALVWRANRVINFAQGDLGVLPATLAVLLVVLGGLPWVVGVTAGLGAAVVVGVLADVLVVRRFFGAPRLLLTVATIGLAQVLAFGSLLLPQLWGEGPGIRTLPPPFEWSGEFGGVVFDGSDLLAVVVAPLLILALAVLLGTTDTGIAVRASAERAERAALLGVPVRRLEVQIWTIATVLSFASVVLTAGVTSLPFGVGLGLSVVLRALAALVIGRMTNLVAIATTAVAIGVLERGVEWNTNDVLLLAPILAAMILVSLLLQRQGRTRADRDVASSWQGIGDVRPTPRVLAALPEVRAARWALGGVVVTLLLVGPHLMGTNGQLKAGVVVAFALVGVSIVVLTGWAGPVSLGQMAFVGVGAAIGARALSDWGWEPVTAMLVAAVAGAVVAVLVGLPALRLDGLYLAVTTLALSLAASAWIFSNRIAEWIPTGSFRRPELLRSIDVDTPVRLYYLSLAVLAVVLLALRGVRRSRTGRVLVALRDNEPGVSAFGVSPVRAKLTAFAISGAVAAIAGVLFVLQQGAFRPVTYAPEESLTVFVATVIGGLATLTGGVLGAVFQRGAQWLLPAPWSFLATGAGVLLVLLTLPDGLGALLWRVRDRFVRWAARRHRVDSLALERSAGADRIVDAGVEAVPEDRGIEIAEHALVAPTTAVGNTVGPADPGAGS